MERIETDPLLDETRRRRYGGLFGGGARDADFDFLASTGASAEIGQGEDDGDNLMLPGKLWI